MAGLNPSVDQHFLLVFVLVNKSLDFLVFTVQLGGVEESTHAYQKPIVEVGVLDEEEIIDHHGC